MFETLLALTIIPVAGIAGWTIVASARALGRGRGAPSDSETARQVEALDATVAALRAEIDQLAAQQEEDRQLLEERLDSAERLLTRARGDAP